MMRLARIAPRVAMAKLSHAAPLDGATALGTLRADRTFYDSRLWRDDIRPAKRKRDPLCQRCKALGLVVEGAHVDHWQPISEGGSPTDDANLVSLCHACHSEKTMADRNGTPRFEIAPSAPRTFAIA